MFSRGLAARRVPARIRGSGCERRYGLSGQGDGKEKSSLVCSAWKSEAEITGGFSHQERLLSSVASLRLILTFREYLAGIMSEESFCLRSWTGVCQPLWEDTPSQHGVEEAEGCSASPGFPGSPGWGSSPAAGLSSECRSQH